MESWPPFKTISINSLTFFEILFEIFSRCKICLVQNENEGVKYGVLFFRRCEIHIYRYVHVHVVFRGSWSLNSYKFTHLHISLKFLSMFTCVCGKEFSHNLGNAFSDTVSSVCVRGPCFHRSNLPLSVCNLFLHHRY